jgi:ribulose 1,5-bisphosphate synthetase/thiazole synthase
MDGSADSKARPPGGVARRVGMFLVNNSLTRLVVGMFLVGVAASSAQRAGRMLPTVGGVSPSTLAGAAAARAGYARLAL